MPSGELLSIASFQAEQKPEHFPASIMRAGLNMIGGAILREEQIGDCRLILGDSMDVLPELVGVADCVVSDVPYKLTSGGNAVQTMGGIFAQEAYDNSGDLVDVVRWGEMGGPIYRACKADADCYIMTNDKNLFAAHAGFTGSGFKFHNLLAWNKQRATRNRWYMKNLEYTLFLWRGKATVINHAGSVQLFTLNEKRQTEHPTEKPIALMQHYIRNSTNRGDTVLDPFMGSGTTAVAAALLSRKCIGIEIDPDYFEIACARVRAAYGGAA